MALLAAATLPTPNLLTVLRSGDDNVLLWTVSNRKVTTFRIERKVDAGAWSELTTKAGGLLSDTHTDANVTTAGTYNYRVVAVRGGREATSNEQSIVVGNPGGESLLSFSDLTHVGSFRVQISGYDYGLAGLSYNPANNSLFSAGHETGGAIGEFSIPASLSMSTSYSSLPNASVVQSLRGASMPDMDGIPGNGQWYVRGTHVVGSDVIVTLLLGYDANGAMTKSHGRFVGGATNLAGATKEGLFTIGPLSEAYWAGGITTIPSAHQADFGGKTHVCGTCGMSIISRASEGPALCAFDADDLISGSSGDAKPLLYYPYVAGDTMALADPDTSNDYFTHLSRQIGMVWPEGYDCVLFFGSHGKGDPNPYSPGITYGTGTSNPALAGMPVGDGSIYCYDPASSPKAFHGWPYRSKVWAYRKSDLKAVFDGTASAHSLVPYDITDFDMPIKDGLGQIPGAAHDAANRKIYLATGNVGPFGMRAVHVYTYPAAA